MTDNQNFQNRHVRDMCNDSPEQNAKKRGIILR